MFRMAHTMVNKTDMIVTYMLLNLVVKRDMYQINQQMYNITHFQKGTKKSNSTM